jgi:small subunit ribosomal protein S2
MDNALYKELLDAGAHFGHLKRKWNPKMQPYIFMERKGIHIIDLKRTENLLAQAADYARQVAKSGRKIMFVATKKQARDIVEKAAQSVNMPYVTDRWLGGMMTNFSTIRKSVKKMQNIERMLQDGSLTSITKKEKLTLSREHAKLNKVLGGIADLNRIPHVLFIVDIFHEHIAVAEATRLGVKTIAMVDTNSDPNKVDFPIPSNDDASRSIEVVCRVITNAIKEGLAERQLSKDDVEAVTAE